MADFLDPCFTDHDYDHNHDYDIDLVVDQPKAFAPSTPLPALAPSTVRGGGGLGAAEEKPRPLKTTRRAPVLNFGRRGGGGGLTVPTVPVAPSVPSVPHLSTSSFSSFLSIPAPAVPTGVSKPSTFGFGATRPPMPMTFAVGLGPSDFRVSEYYS